MMNIRVGCDTVHIPRFQSVLKRTPAVQGRLFVSHESDGASIESLAGKFALKEAVLKALELEPGCWNDIQVMKEESGRPKVVLSCNTSWKIMSQDVSISHDGDCAFAVAVFLVQD